MPDASAGGGLGNEEMVGVAGFEPTTPCPPDKCANRAALHSDGGPYSEAGLHMQCARLRLGGSRERKNAFAFADIGERGAERLKISRRKRGPRVRRRSFVGRLALQRSGDKVSLSGS